MKGRIFAFPAVPAACCVFTLLVACGCRTSYNEAIEARRDVVFGSGEMAEKRAAAMADSTVNRRLGGFELARLMMLKGEIQGASTVFAPRLDELFTETNEGPMLKTDQIAGNVLAGTLADDRAITYELPAFELLFGLQYQALNSLCLGQHDNARVYLKRATAAQEQLKAENGSNVDPVPSGDKASQENAQNASTASAEIVSKLSPVADTVRSSYESALAWYLMGLFLEKENDASNAAIAYGEASRINPAVGSCVKPAPGLGTDVVLVYEEGLVDLQEPVKIPLPFGGTIWSVDFPIYSAPASVPASFSVEVGGARVASCVPAVNVQALAYRTLRDRIPGVAVRNVTRAAVKIAAQQVANHINTGNSFGDLASMVGVFLFNTASTAISEADTRCWQTLPEHVHLARFKIAPGTKSFTMRNAQTGLAVEIPVSPGGSRLVWVSDFYKEAVVTDVALDRSGPGGVTRTSSLLAMPTTVQPVAVQPAVVQPVAVQPVAVQPVVVQPAVVQPVVVQPPAVIQPVRPSKVPLGIY